MDDCHLDESLATKRKHESRRGIFSSSSFRIESLECS